MSIRAAFAEKFGEKQTVALENAADMHDNSIHPNRGSDPFKWVILITIGHECFTRFADYHKITIPVEELKIWIRENADLGSHNGDCDFLALACGSYNEYMKEDKENVPTQ